MRFCVYIHMRPDGAPFYVGKGKTRRTTELFRSRNKFHRNIVNKYGPENIGIRIIKRDLSEHDAFAYEINAIECLKDFGYKLTNLTNGGEGFCGGRHTTKFVERVRAQLKGNKYRVGKKDTSETMTLKSSVLMGNKRRQGKLLSDAIKEEKRLLMLSHNPMNNPQVRMKHKARMADAEVKAKRSIAIKLAWQRRKQICISQ